MTIFEPKIHDGNAALGRGVELVNPENRDDEGDLYGSGSATHTLAVRRENLVQLSRSPVLPFPEKP
jgi:hypothetical protein